MPVLDEAMHLAKHEKDVYGHHITASVQSDPYSNGHAKQAKSGKLAPKEDFMDLLSFLPDEQPASLQKYDGDSLLNMIDAGSITGSNSSMSPGNPLHNLEVQAVPIKNLVNRFVCRICIQNDWFSSYLLKARNFRSVVQ